MQPKIDVQEISQLMESASALADNESDIGLTINNYDLFSARSQDEHSFCLELQADPNAKKFKVLPSPGFIGVVQLRVLQVRLKIQPKQADFPTIK